MLRFFDLAQRLGLAEAEAEDAAEVGAAALEEEAASRTATLEIVGSTAELVTAVGEGAAEVFTTTDVAASELVAGVALEVVGAAALDVVGLGAAEVAAEVAGAAPLPQKVMGKST